MKILLTILLAFPFWNTFQKTATINELQESAQQAYAAKDYRKAIMQYEELIKVYHCDDIRIYHNLGTAYFRILQYRQAERIFKIIISRDEAPYNSYCYNNMGIMYFRAGQYSKAQEQFKKSLSLFPNNAEARYNYEVVSITLTKDTPLMSNAAQEKKSKMRQTSADKSTTNGSSGVTSQTPKPSSAPSSQSGNKTGGGLNGKGSESIHTINRLKEMNTNPQHAEHLLELLRRREVQYIHQQKSKEEGEQGYPNW